MKHRYRGYSEGRRSHEQHHLHSPPPMILTFHLFHGVQSISIEHWPPLSAAVVGLSVKVGAIVGL